jgi:hypothetical protein
MQVLPSAWAMYPPGILAGRKPTTRKLNRDT